MKIASFILAVVVSGFVAGCSPHKQAVSEVGSISTNGIPAQFAFITTNTTLQEVVDRVGKYDRVRGSGILYYEYDLPDGSALLISPVPLFQPSRQARFRELHIFTAPIIFICIHDHDA
jgi:hypothetical protein